METAPVLTITVLCSVLGITAGFVMHRSDFCLAGMFRDLFLFGDRFMLRILLLLVAVTMVAVEALRWLGWLPAYPFLLLSPPSLATLLGAAVFGVGMVLAGGCVVGTLYKMGSGSVPSWVAFAGLIAGSGLYAEMHPGWSAVFQALRLDNSGARTVPAALGLSPAWFVVPVALMCAVLLRRWVREGKLSVRSAARGYLQPWKAALVLSLVTAVSYGIVGMPLGITTFYAKLAALAESLLIPKHAAAVAFFSAMPLDAPLPAFDIRLQGGPGPGWDAIAFIQGSVIVGIVAGAFVSSILLREFRPTFQIPPRQLVFGFLGGVALALGSRMASGCNVWYLLGGLPTFASQSLFFLAGMLGGTWVGTLLLTRVVLPSSTPEPIGSTP